MRERLLVLVAAAALLAAVALTGLFSASIHLGVRTGVQVVLLEQVAKAGHELKCQSGAGCGG
jgi:hypothetical protein